MTALKTIQEVTAEFEAKVQASTPADLVFGCEESGEFFDRYDNDSDDEVWSAED